MARKTARQVAMQLIYQYELGGEGVNSTIEETMDKPELNADDLAYIQAMVDGTMDKEDELEESRQLDVLLSTVKKIPDPAVFADDPEGYMKLTGME